MDTQPTLRSVSALPLAVRRLPVPKGYRVSGGLEAHFPAPFGTVYLRYLVHTELPARLEVVTPQGGLLQRTESRDLPDKLPTRLSAHCLDTARKRGPLLRLLDDEWVYLWAFPDGFSGLLSLNQIPHEAEKNHVWSGVSFVEKGGTVGPDWCRASAPTRLPVSPYGTTVRFGAVRFETTLFLRWVSERRSTRLEVLDRSGKILARHRLTDSFTADDDFVGMTADWLDTKRKRGPVLIARTSDSVRVHVFTDGLRALVCEQDFSDFSTSISATHTVFGRDKSGLLTVSEDYSERGDEEGNPSENNHVTDYVWKGKGFVKVK